MYKLRMQAEEEEKIIINKLHNYFWFFRALSNRLWMIHIATKSWKLNPYKPEIQGSLFPSYVNIT